jgi:hypothetical protein
MMDDGRCWMLDAGVVRVARGRGERAPQHRLRCRQLSIDRGLIVMRRELVEHVPMGRGEARCRMADASPPSSQQNRQVEQVEPENGAEKQRAPLIHDTWRRSAHDRAGTAPAVLCILLIARRLPPAVQGAASQAAEGSHVCGVPDRARRCRGSASPPPCGEQRPRSTHPTSAAALSGRAEAARVLQRPGP